MKRHSVSGPGDIPTRLIGVDAVCRITSRSRSSIYRDVEKGLFPSPVKTGPKSNAWLLSEIQEWIGNLPRRKAEVRS